MSELDGTPITSSCRCKRCKGLVVDELFLSESRYWLKGLRCINCGWVKIDEEATIEHANKTKNRRVDKLDELELYRTRRRNPKCHSHNVQY